MNFNFSTNPTDISFGIEFVSAPKPNEVISDNVKMQSVLELKKINCSKGPLLGYVSSTYSGR